MPTPLKPLPPAVGRWAARARAVRVVDALAGWLAAWVALACLELGPAGGTAILALIPVGIGVWWSAVRTRWRPISAALGVIVSSPLRPGDRAWYIRPETATMVLVTARRGVRLVIARASGDAAEGISVRRTRVLLIPVAPDS